jgi:hypothetical protein
LKKKGNFTIQQINEGKSMATASKPERYIYTEADLGEGILDEGVISSYKTRKRRASFKKPVQIVVQLLFRQAELAV